MDDVMNLEPKITLIFAAYHGEETFTFTKDEILKIATMPAKNYNSENKISLQNNRFFAIRDMNEFQYYYRSGTGTRGSASIFYFPNIAKKIFKVINEPIYLNSDGYNQIINITEQDYMMNNK
ncbi:hypothetical protein Arnit_1491 [Arcobacter nitrofigilis DSM 7299]|uniref:Uncharacterized protein n=1 Tax=Arcobacter nitrofigilis (strain ATCC 33309 / DSM 7299 / CCUG 15893 / LMG 7604 / NCTC 12251 / CI) TaxID=572480 RepID=D5V5Y0_ARCNC|nr:hypothetical protein [Arcobacter nitrofigilis]ADG93147.1 hypothetical protein Arnit_1491 [Arcobacter nitrofigilis DSM 7299]